MLKDKIVRTKQGNLEIWEHEVGTHNPLAEQKYASRIFNKVKSRNIFKIHSSAQELQVYIDDLNLIIEDCSVHSTDS